VIRLIAQDWLDTAEWMRDGRGRDWTFAMSTDELVSGLSAVSDASEGRLELLACSRTREPPESLSVYVPTPIDRLSVDGPRQYFIRSTVLSPTVPTPEPLAGVGWPAIFAVNGLIGLHHPDPSFRSEPPRSSIGIVHRVWNERTGATLEHEAYDRLFKALKRELRRRASSN
jgi:hypothetical protein